MEWFKTIVRVAGSAFPGAAQLVQLQSEIEADALLQRVKRLEDPISFLHEDVPDLSRLIYDSVKSANRSSLKFEDDVYLRFSRAFAALDAKHHVKLKQALGRDLPIGISVTDPSYIMYLCARFEDEGKMERLIKAVDGCAVGKSLDGHVLQSELELPLPVIKASFDIYEAKGYGICSREIGRVLYCGNA